MLRALGANFTMLTAENANAINVPGFAAAQRPRIGKAADDTSWLTGDEILMLATLDNPDGANIDARAWMRGPAHLGYHHTFFAQTLNTLQLQGVVHIMVVNTFKDTRAIETGTAGGHH